MDTNAATRHVMYGNAHSFCLHHHADFNQNGKFILYTNALGDVITGLTGANVGQLGGDPDILEMATDDFRLELQNIARTARSIAPGQDPPLALNKFRLGKTRTRGGLLKAAQSFLTELERPGVEAQFAGSELPDELVKHLKAQRDLFAEVKVADQNAANDAVKSTGEIRRLVKEGNRLVKQIDAIVHNRYARQPQLLNAWKSARHVERVARRQINPEPAPSAGPGPAPAAPAAPAA